MSGISKYLNGWILKSTPRSTTTAKNLWPNILSAERAALKVAPNKLGAKYNDLLWTCSESLTFAFWDSCYRICGNIRRRFGIIPYKALIKQIVSCLSIPGCTTGSEEEAEAQHEKSRSWGFTIVITSSALVRRIHSLLGFLSMGPVLRRSGHPSRPSLDIVRDRIINDKDPNNGGQRSYECELHCAHIFPETAQDGEQKVLAILQLFGLDIRTQSLVGANFHKHLNLLTMRSDLHYLFDRLKFWLEEVIGEENTYKIGSIKDKVFKMGLPVPASVTFWVDPGMVAACTTSKTDLPALPSPSLLAIRAAFSRIAHMSGVAN
ncbi:hypothetical protein C8R45DRAFT_1057040 [Mycena sanguinolenta]|nr:hypothetical protein C8R45DRAFT_1057040 [Mycena sanguinolenta]